MAVIAATPSSRTDEKYSNIFSCVLNLRRRCSYLNSVRRSMRCRAVSSGASSAAAAAVAAAAGASHDDGLVVATAVTAPAAVVAAAHALHAFGAFTC